MAGVDPIDVVFSFDTTGSMYPVLGQVRDSVERTVKELFDSIPGLRVGIITHGDYCDGPRMITLMDLTADKNKIIQFIRFAPATGGGDEPEAYEQALKSANGLSWSVGKNKALVMIGDEVPHPPSHFENKNRTDWRKELSDLHSKNVGVYGIQCYPHGRAYGKPREHFYTELAQLSGGFKLDLDQFPEITATIMAICFKQAGPEHLQRFQEQVQARGEMTSGLSKTFSTLSGKTVEVAGKKMYFSKSKRGKLHPVEPGTFKQMHVHSDSPISDFVASHGMDFSPGKGFYQLTKRVKIQEYKRVVVEYIPSGEMFTGPNARKILDLPEKGTVDIKPDDFGDFRIYVQSTSTNRKLLNGTKFLYEIDSAVVTA